MITNAKILDGLKASDAIVSTVRKAIESHIEGGGRRPGLAVVLVGSDTASSIYVRAKRKDCDKAGILARDIDLPEETQQDALLALRQPGLRPCTPRGVMSLLTYNGIKVISKHAVVVGASNIVGRPMTLELLLQGATVTTSHRFTKDLESLVRQSDILISAMGKRGVIESEWIPRGCIVVDVGINRTAEGKIKGDIEFESAVERAAWISPVPGGVGPMTRATLMQNTAEAAGIEIVLPCGDS